MSDQPQSPKIDRESGPSVASVGEFSLIDRLRASVAGTLAPATVGIGDDCSVVVREFAGTRIWLCTTIDSMAEHTHFETAFTSARDLGWKLLAVSLSDAAAMGAAPAWAVVSLQAPSATAAAWVEALYEGMAELAIASGVEIVGGDTVSGDRINLSLTLNAVSDSQPILRSGAQPGDELWVSGTIGLGNLGLLVCRGAADELPDEIASIARARYCKPQARVALGLQLRAGSIATAMIDVSDGLLQDAGHIARLSNVVLELEESAVPVCDVPAAIDGYMPLTGGDDYELLFTVSSQRATALEALKRELPEIALTRIGSVKAPSAAEKPGVRITSSAGTRLSAAEFAAERYKTAGVGFEHFRK